MTKADFQSSGIELVVIEKFIILVNMGARVSGISFRIYELIPEHPGEQGDISLIRSLTWSTEVSLTENPAREVCNLFSFLSCLKRSSVKLTHSSFFEIDNDPIDVKKLLKSSDSSIGSVTGVSSLIISAAKQTSKILLNLVQKLNNQKKPSPKKNI